MKKISVSVLSLLMVMGGAFANFEGPDATAKPEVQHHANPKGGFVGGNETIVTIEQVNEMRDGVPVVVVGRIVQRTGDEKYLFEDDGGSIIVEIDDEDWRGQTVAPTDTVKLFGEVDRGIFKTEIEIDYVEKQ